MYSNFFSPEVIVSKGIKEVMVYTKPNNSTTQYKEAKYAFNNKGYVIAATFYYAGIPNSMQVFKRTKTNKIYQQIQYDLDSLERKIPYHTPEITSLKYDAKNRLIKLQKGSFNRERTTNSKSDYTLFKYDNKDRIVSIENFYYNYNGSLQKSIANYIYNDSLSTVIKESFRNGKLSTTGEAKLNSRGTIIYFKLYKVSLKEVALEQHFIYNSLNQLIEQKSKNYQEGGSECLEGQTYTDKFQYNDNTLIASILHTFQENSCEMTFEYNK
ncbi:hypothetical protein [Flavobacterium sp. J27]|uniref:hypothetical protein n=1 Tax=Flavobacterium sp. J27 TaxID=2060419 RepID=UPI00103250E8|nr:hypothetical protein [Flavobacterium sp. J27]